jgi:pimeloyl-ACP methyl ester carboxylesterase/class 3 adenylate cyclase
MRDDSPVDEGIRYARNGNVHIAYKVLGDGDVTVLFVPTWMSNLDLAEEYAPIAKSLERLASFARVILVDRRGSGLSDRTHGMATLEEGADDLVAVLDDAGVDRSAVIGLNESSTLCALFAATKPERVSALVLYGSYAATVRQDDYPWAPTPEERDAQVDLIVEHWGNPQAAFMISPSAGSDVSFQTWAGKWMRNAVTRDALRPAYEMLSHTDVRHVLPTIRVPTLILHRTDDVMVPVENARYIADKIPDSKLVEFPGQEPFPFFGDWESIADEIEEFLTGQRRGRETDRVLATILITDIVASSKKAAELGDERWSDVLDAHYRMANRYLDRYQGRLIKTVGDGIIATFDGPARGIRAAAGFSQAVRELGLEIRSGLHTGEIELFDGDIGGIAVHIADRVCDLAGGGEVLVSNAVPPLVAGSGIDFEPRGTHELRGIEGDWQLFRVAT